LRQCGTVVIISDPHLVVDPDLEAGRAPVHKLNTPLRLDNRNRRIDILRHHIAPVQHAAGHVLAASRIALHHRVGRLETGVRDLGHTQGLVIGPLSGDNRRIGDKREMDARIGDKIRLKLVEIDVQGAVEAKRGCDGGDNLGDEAVEVGVGGRVDVEVAATDVVDGLVVDHEGAVGVLQGGVSAQGGVVGFHHRRRDLEGEKHEKLALLQIRIHMFLGFPDPDPSIIKQI
jgi:hypothetical protein